MIWGLANALLFCGALAGQDTDTGVNLAVAAAASTSNVSGHESLEAIQDGFDPRNSNDRRHAVYGNWPRTGTQWVEYTWSQPISTKRIDVYWFDDDRGIDLPQACRLLYWNGQAFSPVGNVSGLGLEANRFNTTAFDEVQTTRLRLEIDSKERSSTGILEWRVYDSGKSPDFPPRVDAGPDRVVVRGGRTYLNGRVTMLKGDAAAAAPRWSKQSGPGEVAFAAAASASTAATLSQAGDYVLELTAGKADAAASSSLRVRVIEPQPAGHLEFVDPAPYRLDSPFFHDRIRGLIVNWIPHCIRKISDPDLKDGGINNFLDAADKLAGKPHGPHRGYVFSNAWVHNTVETICLALMVDPRGDAQVLAAQEQLRATLEDWIPKILAAQEPDGYLQTAFTLSDRPRWTPRHRGDHEGYVAGYFLDAAVAHHTLTGGADRRLFDAARRLADCWDRHLGPPPKQAWYDGHQAMEIGLVSFGRYVNRVEGAGQGDRYIALARFLLDSRGGGSEYDQSHLPVVQQYEAVGHAVRAVYSYAGMADIALETGDVDYQSAVMSLWDNLVHRKYYVTGGVGSGETPEGFGPDYSLRHNGYCESCSSCGEIFFQHRLNLIYQDARYADLVEETLYNALLGSLDLEGKNFYYDNPLDERGTRYDWHACPCCVGNIPRTLLMLPTWAYARDEQGICVNQFVGSTVTIPAVAGVDVQLVQATDYPRSGEVVLTVNPAEPREFAVRIRVPDRSVSELYSSSPASDGIESISVNGQPVALEIQRGYAVIARRWQAGDTLRWSLPMRIQRIKGIDKIPATVGQTALRRGPLIYSFESVDQELDKVLRPEAGLEVQWRSDLLGGVPAIRGQWSDGSPLLAVPNYVRNHRGGRSTVWVRDE